MLDPTSVPVLAERELLEALEAEDVTMTVGAAGALNVLFRAVLNPDDEVMVPAPYFSEYDHYAANVGAAPVSAAAPVEATPPLRPSQGARIFLAGAACSSAAHTLLVPIDVVKTTLQQRPAAYAGAA